MGDIASTMGEDSKKFVHAYKTALKFGKKPCLRAVVLNYLCFRTPCGPVEMMGYPIHGVMGSGGIDCLR